MSQKVKANKLFWGGHPKEIASGNVDHMIVSSTGLMCYHHLYYTNQMDITEKWNKTNYDYYCDTRW